MSLKVLLSDTRKKRTRLATIASVSDIPSTKKKPTAGNPKEYKSSLGLELMNEKVEHSFLTAVPEKSRSLTKQDLESSYHKYIGNSGEYKDDISVLLDRLDQLKLEKQRKVQKLDELEMQLKNVKLQNGKKVNSNINVHASRRIIYEGTFTSENEQDTVTITSEGDLASRYLEDMMSLHSKPCKGSLATVRKLKERSLLKTKYHSRTTPDIFTEFDIQKLRHYEYSPSTLHSILTSKLSKISSKLESQKNAQEEILQILKREKSQKSFNSRKMLLLNKYEITKTMIRDQQLGRERKRKMESLIGFMKKKIEVQNEKFREQIKKKSKELKQESQQFQKHLESYGKRFDYFEQIKFKDSKKKEETGELGYEEIIRLLIQTMGKEKGKEQDFRDLLSSFPQYLKDPEQFAKQLGNINLDKHFLTKPEFNEYKIGDTLNARNDLHLPTDTPGLKPLATFNEKKSPLKSLEKSKYPRSELSSKNILAKDEDLRNNLNTPSCSRRDKDIELLSVHTGQLALSEKTQEILENKDTKQTLEDHLKKTNSLKSQYDCQLAEVVKKSKKLQKLIKERDQLKNSLKSQPPKLSLSPRNSIITPQLATPKASGVAPNPEISAQKSKIRHEENLMTLIEEDILKSKKCERQIEIFLNESLSRVCFKLYKIRAIVGISLSKDFEIMKIITEFTHQYPEVRNHQMKDSKLRRKGMTMRGGSVHGNMSKPFTGFEPSKSSRSKSRRRTDYTFVDFRKGLCNGNLNKFIRIVNYINNEIQNYKSLWDKCSEGVPVNKKNSSLKVPENNNMPLKGSIARPVKVSSTNQDKMSTKDLDNLLDKGDKNSGNINSIKLLDKDYDKFVTIYSPRKHIFDPQEERDQYVPLSPKEVEDIDPVRGKVKQQMRSLEESYRVVESKPKRRKSIQKPLITPSQKLRENERENNANLIKARSELDSFNKVIKRKKEFEDCHKETTELMALINTNLKYYSRNGVRPTHLKRGKNRTQKLTFNDVKDKIVDKITTERKKMCCTSHRSHQRQMQEIWRTTKPSYMSKVASKSKWTKDLPKELELEQFEAVRKELFMKQLKIDPLKKLIKSLSPTPHLSKTPLPHPSPTPSFRQNTFRSNFKSHFGVEITHILQSLQSQHRQELKAQKRKLKEAQDI
ncbi:unnamed protein product [Moneuplotes crassus]|uniref:Uncharacterized protein n=1 Tax=Euplotes crassus TaxID=5936 RepID=A0AAD1U908_EUPCR|nr:unnamed protein product [Moneuplotes crassus]